MAKEGESTMNSADPGGLQSDGGTGGGPGSVGRWLF